MEAALGAAQALYKTHGTVMKTGSLCDKLYRFVSFYAGLAIRPTYFHATALLETSWTGCTGKLGLQWLILSCSEIRAL